MGISDAVPDSVNHRLSSEYLRESNLLNLIPEAVYVCDMSGIIQKYNEQAVHLWGRRPVLGDSDERFCGAWKLYYPDGTYLPHDQTPVAACLKDGLPRKNMEVVIERPDQSRVHVLVNITPITDTDGIQVGMINCFYDITEKKKTEKDIQRKLAALQDYVENANIGLHWVDENGIIKWANRAELDMLGYNKEEYIGHHIAEFHVDRKKIEEILYKLSCKEILSQYESELYCKDGAIKTVHISSSVFWEDGKFVHTRCFTVDITEHKKLTKAIEGSELRYRTLIETLPTPLYTTDTEGRITLYNKAAVELWGREPEIGKDLWCGSFRILNADGSPLPLDSCPMAVCLREKRPVHGEEIIVIRPDGSLRDVAPHPQPVYDDQGNMTGAINMLVDITGIKQVKKA
ncbi:MAG TPA: PAS domain S-box protein, partial [Niastella sp.]